MENTLALEYNSQRPDLEISEYGRHIQKLVKFAKTIEKDDERQEFVEQLIHLMHQMNPQAKNMDDYIQKLWRHVFRIANYELNVTPPEGVATEPIAKEAIELKLHYPQSEFNHRHYGHNVQVLIDKAIEMEDEAKRNDFTKVIAAYMKLAYNTWNKEHHVNDDIIRNDISILSKGKLKLEEDYNINVLKSSGGNAAKKNNRRNRKNRTKNNKRK